MNIKSIIRRWKVSALGFLVLTVLVACTVTPGGYVGGVYEPSGSDYGGWGPGYHVGTGPPWRTSRGAFVSTTPIGRRHRPGRSRRSRRVRAGVE